MSGQATLPADLIPDNNLTLIGLYHIAVIMFTVVTTAAFSVTLIAIVMFVVAVNAASCTHVAIVIFTVAVTAVFPPILPLSDLLLLLLLPPLDHTATFIFIIIVP